MAKHVRVYGAFFMLASQHLWASDIYVSKFTDSFDGKCDADCSLREAVQLANQTEGHDTIHLNAGRYVVDIPLTGDTDDIVPDNDTNAEGDIDIQSDITLKGAGNTVTVIDANNKNRALEVLAGSVEIHNMRFENGFSLGDGGAIENHATLNIHDVVFSNNTADIFISGDYGEAYGGGAISNHGTLTLTRTEFDRNQLIHDGLTYFKHRSGGAIFNDGKLAVYASRFYKNYSKGDEHFSSGGALGNVGELVVRDSYFAMNFVIAPFETAGGAVYNFGKADIRRSVFYKNIGHGVVHRRGAAIANEAGATLKLVNSTLAKNSAYATDRRGHNSIIESQKTAQLFITHSTIVENRGYGVITYGDMYLKNSIITGNYNPNTQAPINCTVVGGAEGVKYTHVGVMIGASDTDAACETDFPIEDENSLNTLFAPKYEPDSLFGVVYHLKDTSPAIDKGVSPCPTRDQLNQATDNDGDGDGIGQCDLGAVEWGL